MHTLRRIKNYLLFAAVISLILFTTSPAATQGLFPYFNPFLSAGYYGNPFYGYSVGPYIRTAINPVPLYSNYHGNPWATSSLVTPRPVYRNASATITLWNTTGTVNSLLIYNPTSLLGPSAAPVTPSPLLSLIAGSLLTAGADPLSTANPALFNYLANSFLLPSGLALYLFP